MRNIYQSDALEVKVNDRISCEFEDARNAAILKSSLAKVDVSKHLELMDVEDHRLSRLVKEILHYKSDIGPLLTMIKRHSAYRQNEVIVSV